MSTSPAPVNKTLVVILVFTWCFAVISSSFGLNALVKSNQDKSRLKKLAPAQTVVHIDTSDILGAGISATVASLVIAIVLSICFLAPLLPFTRKLAQRTLGLQTVILFLCSLWLLGSQIGYQIYFATRHAKVTAFIGGVQLPDAVVKNFEKASGSTTIYKDIRYLQYSAYFPWFTLLFTWIATIALFFAYKRRKNTPVSVPATSAASEKEDVSHHESADKASV